MRQDVTTPAEQDYLKSVFALGEFGDRVTIGVLANYLGLAQPSVTAMVKKLTAKGLLAHEPQGDVRFTSPGRRAALVVVRRHRLVETFLAQTLGLTWDEVHDEAEVLEHSVSDALASRMAAYLGHPSRDPHGDPIPMEDGTYPALGDVLLTSVAAGSRARIVRVKDRRTELLQYLDELGLRLGTELVVEGMERFGGPMWIATEARRHALGPEVTEAIFVELLDAAT